MHFFENLFGNHTKTQHSAVTNTPALESLEDLKANMPAMDLFVDNEAPQVQAPERPMTKDNISTFLNRNYKGMGINDGYEYHSNETLAIGKSKIRSEFQLLIDQMIEEKSERRLQLRMMLVNIERISDETSRNLELTVAELNDSIALLKTQKELSAENEGWVMNAIHGYHQGFVQGLNDYVAGENLLNSIKNI
jgi:hypothetical protein